MSHNMTDVVGSIAAGLGGTGMGLSGTILLGLIAWFVGKRCAGKLSFSFLKIGSIEAKDVQMEAAGASPDSK